MVSFFKAWASRRKAKSSADKAVASGKITREEIRDLFADVLAQKAAVRR